MSTPTGAVSGSLNNDEYKKHREIMEKPWAECSTDEKLEKVKEELTQLGHMGYTLSNLSNGVNKLKEHTHAEGKVVIALNANVLNGLGIGGASRRNNLA